MKENLHIKTLKTIFKVFLILICLVCVASIAIIIGNISVSIKSFNLRCLFLGAIYFICLYIFIYCKLKEDSERAKWFKVIEEERKNDKK